MHGDRRKRMRGCVHGSARAAAEPQVAAAASTAAQVGAARMQVVRSRGDR